MFFCLLGFKSIDWVVSVFISAPTRGFIILPQISASQNFYPNFFSDSAYFSLGIEYHSFMKIKK